MIKGHACRSRGQQPYADGQSRERTSMTIQKAERSASPPGTAPGNPGSDSSDPPGRSLLPPRFPAPAFACPEMSKQGSGFRVQGAEVPKQCRKTLRLVRHDRQ